MSKPAKPTGEILEIQCAGPESVTIRDDVGVPAERMHVSREEAEAACRVLGMSRLAAKRLKAANLVGKHINQEGVIETAAGDILATNAAADRLIKTGVSLGVNTKDAATFCELVKALTSLIQTKQKAQRRS